LNSYWNQFLEYATLGFEHIWTGYDHLLFLLAVLIGKGSKWDYVKILTAFTVGHSITLALASWDIVSISPSIIEPLIALSIVLASGESLLRKSIKGRWKFTLFFGLIHGFGFAGILKGFFSSNFVLALFSFNLGVEIGQIVFAAVFLPLLIYVRAKTESMSKLKYALPVVIGMLGLYWFSERVFL
jgi:hypothetical protein